MMVQGLVDLWIDGLLGVAVGICMEWWSKWSGEGYQGCKSYRVELLQGHMVAKSQTVRD